MADSPVSAVLLGVDGTLPTLRPFRDAEGLVAALKARNLTAVVASSAQKDELRRLLDIAGVLSLLDGAASSDVPRIPNRIRTSSRRRCGKRTSRPARRS